MTWKTSIDCNNCNASYELTVWDLGHKESDSIRCECCKNILKEWKNESKSFSISATLRKGSIKLNNENFSIYLNKKIRIEKSSLVYEGVLIGISDAVQATGVATVEHPLVLQTSSEDVHFSPSERWQISLI